MRQTRAERIEVRRGDGELCGYVVALERGESSEGGWSAQVVFGVEIGRHASEADARQHVETRGSSILRPSGMAARPR
ncbi:MAG: hypothetical protein R2715_21110 [Ilumatobacteraceae bacterium]